jgi:hypothetical protein
MCNWNAVVRKLAAPSSWYQQVCVSAISRSTLTLLLNADRRRPRAQSTTTLLPVPWAALAPALYGYGSRISPL